MIDNTKEVLCVQQQEQDVKTRGPSHQLVQGPDLHSENLMSQEE